MSRNKPGNVFLHDDLDKVNPGKERFIIQPDYRISLIRLVAGILIGALIIAIHFFGWYLLSTQYYLAGYFLISIIYVPFGFLTIGATLGALIWGFNVARAKGLVNLMQHQTHLDSMRNHSDRYFDVQERKAARLFPKVQNMTYAPEYHTREREADESIEEIRELPLLDELKRDGLIARSGNSFLIGFMED